MNRARSATAIIWSTVVSAAAMLGTAGCTRGAPTTTPAPAAEFTETGSTEDDPVAVAATVEITAVAVAPVPIEDAPAPTTPIVAPAVIELRVESAPYGAKVYRGGVQLGVTPLMVTMPASDDPLTLQLTHAGYDDQALTVHPAADVAVKVTLVKAKRVRGTTLGTIKVGGSGKGTGRGFILS